MNEQLSHILEETSLYRCASAHKSISIQYETVEIIWPEDNYVISSPDTFFRMHIADDSLADLYILLFEF